MALLTFDEARGQLQALVDAAQPGTYRREALEEVVDVASMLATAREARAFVMNAYLHTRSTPDGSGRVGESMVEKHAAYLDAAMVLGRVLDDLILPGASAQGTPPDPPDPPGEGRGDLSLEEGARHDGC